MAFLIGGANSDSGAYQIDNSGMFNGSDQYISKTFGSEESVLTKWTVSAWVKRGNLSNGSDHQYFFQAGDYSIVGFRDDNTLMVQVWNSDGGGKAVLTNAKYRDVGAWYHIVAEYDSTDGTAANRLKLYVNGEEVTSFGTDQRSSISQNDDDLVGDDVAHTIGYGSNNTSYFDGYMADVHVICGNHYPASYFGETNDNGVWVPKKFTGNYGSNGSFHEFGGTSTGVGAGRFASDTSGNGNHYDTNNFAGSYQMTDSPTNNFCTYNPLDPGSGSTFSKGNLNTNTGDNKNDIGTIGFENGKWYWEVTCSGSGVVGVQHESVNHLNDTNLNDNVGSVAFSTYHGTIFHNNNQDTTPPNDRDGQILGCAVDMDNNKIYWHVDGTYIDTTGGTQNPTDGSNPITVATGTNTSGFWFPKLAAGTSSQTFQTNFGNPSTTISSGNSDGNGYGNFEHSVPSGFYAICTKNLAEFG